MSTSISNHLIILALSVMASYYFGNLSYPSRDPPRLGLLSTVPENAGDLLRAAVLAAKQANNNFPGVCHSCQHVVYKF